MPAAAAKRAGGRRSRTGGMDQQPGRAGGADRPTGRERRAEARRRAELARADAEERRGLPTSVLVVGIAALVAILVGVALVSGFLTPPGGAAKTSKTPAATLRTVLRPQSAADMAIVSGTGWVLDDNAGTIRRFDPSSGSATGPARHVASRPVSLAAGFGKLWVADAVGNAVVAVSEQSGRAVGSPITVAQEPVSVAAGEGGIWVASLGGGSVSLIDPRSRTVTASVALPDGAVRVAVGDGAVWVTGQTDTLTRISPKPVGVSLSWKAVRVGAGPIGVTTTPGAVWVADAVGGAVTKVDPKHLRVTATYAIGSGGVVAGTESPRAALGHGAGDPLTVAFADGLLWIGDGRTGTLSALDPATGTQHDGAVSLMGLPRHLVVSPDGALWITTANPGRVLQVQPR